MQWPLAEAKQKLSEIIERAVIGKPQFISKRGIETAVVLSAEHYRKLSAEEINDFKTCLLSGPPLDGIELQRDMSPPRQIDL